MTSPPVVSARPSRPPGRVPAASPMPTRRRLRPRDFGLADVGLLGASLLSSFCVVWILFDQLTFLSGWIGFVLCWFVAFLAVYWAVNFQVNGSRLATDRVVAAVVVGGALCMFSPLALIVIFLVERGAKLLSFHLFTATQRGVLEKCIPGFPCTKPGVLHGLVGTGEQIGLAAAIGIPAGILTAIYLNEVGRGRFVRAVRVVVTAMSGVPAILAGAFVYAFWVVQFKRGFSGFAGSLALSVLLLPTVTRGSEEVLRIVPDSLREAAKALGASEWRTVRSVVLPSARSGLVTAVLLGIAVALGETAPLLLTIFGNPGLNTNPFSGPQSALPLIAYEGVRSANQTDIQLAYAAALVLFLMVVMLFLAARLLSSDWLGNQFRHYRNRRASRVAARRTQRQGDLQ